MSERTETFAWGYFDACHRGAEGDVHGHSWEVEAVWFEYDTSALTARYRLELALGELDHTVLPDAISWGEPLARYLGEKLSADIVVIRRQSQRLGARWRRCA